MNYIRHQIEVMKVVALVNFKEWSAYRTHSMVSINNGNSYGRFAPRDSSTCTEAAKMVAVLMKEAIG